MRPRTDLARWRSEKSGRQPTSFTSPSKPVAAEFPPSAIKEWVASHNLEISRTHPDREDSAWDYIGHRFPREKSPGTAVHSTVITEGKWAVEFKILECKGNSGNGMYLGVTDGGASLTQEKGPRVGPRPERGQAAHLHRWLQHWLQRRRHVGPQADAG